MPVSLGDRGLNASAESSPSTPHRCLVCAAGLGAWGIADTIHLARSEDLPSSLERGGISVGFLSLATIYAGIVRRRGFSLIALPSLLVSLLAVALVFFNVRWAAKGFPPSESPARQLAMSAVWWVAALVLCSWLVRCTYVSSWKPVGNKGPYRRLQ